MGGPNDSPAKRSATWPSTIGARDVASGGLRLSEPRLDRLGLQWLEGRPSEGGRVAVMRSDFGAADRVSGAHEVEISRRAVGGDEGDRFSARSRAHEYGGGAHCTSPARADGPSLFVDQGTQRVVSADGAAFGDAGPSRADLVWSPDGRWFACVEEAPRPDNQEPENRIVAYRVEDRVRRVVAEGFDFVASPRFSPEGDRLAFVAWNHPNMPWDSTGLYEVDWGAEGPSAPPRRMGGAPLPDGESIVQPEYDARGRLIAATDRGGFWNLALFEPDRCTALHADRAEYAGPMWVFGLSHYALIDERFALCSVSRDGQAELVRLDLDSGSTEALDVVPFELGIVEGLRVANGRACMLAGGPTTPLCVIELDLGTGETQMLRRAAETLPPRAAISVPEAIEFASAGGRRAHAFHYPPTHPDHELAPGEAPPLLVLSHGGPTAATHPVLDLRVQYWTSRGFAVVDVNYAGSTGYGRAYRESLRERWGIADVEDCVYAARALVERGAADPERLAIAGGSAGGYTTLCALTFHDTFRAGASRYGIGDLELLVRDTHKFEARYCDGLVAPYPEGREVYRERSPIHSVEKLSCPVIFLQGLEDRVVPPNQAETMAAALEARGIPHALVTFEREGHGFRRSESIVRALEAELAFFGAVFGLETDAPSDAVEPRTGSAAGSA